jgi:hypothetical protein
VFLSVWGDWFVLFVTSSLLSLSLLAKWQSLSNFVHEVDAIETANLQLQPVVAVDGGKVCWHLALQYLLKHGNHGRHCVEELVVGGERHDFAHDVRPVVCIVGVA